MTVIQLVERERARLRASNRIMVAAAIVAVTASVVGGGAWLLGGSRWIALPRATPVLVWAALVALNAVAAWFLWTRGRTALAQSSVAAAIETEQDLRAGALRGVIEVPESAIVRRTDRAMAGKLETLGPTLAPALLRSRQTRAAQVSGVAFVTLALLLWAAPSLSDGLLAIRRPFAAWSGSLIPALSFESLPSDLLRGEVLHVRIAAAGRRTLTLSSRATGEGWQTSSLRVDPETGIATTTIGPVRSDITVTATDGRNTTDTVVVRVTDKPFVGGVVLRATYPAYLGRAAEGLPVGEPAAVPRGTVIAVTGRASTRLDRVYIRAEHDSVAFAVQGQAFTGTLAPRQSSRWNWFAFGERVAIADVPLPLEIDVIPDSVPVVELVQPATDTLVAAVDKIQLQITASDDHGVELIELIATRRVARGKAETPVVAKLATQQGTVWNGLPVIDLAPFELQAGDALRLQVAATDNSPWKQRGLSREVVIRIPTMEERRSLARNSADSTANAARNAATQQKSLEQRTDEASKERGNRGNQNNQPSADANKGKDKEMSYESAEKARALAQEQKELAEKIDKLKDAAAALQEQLKEAGALDSSLSRQLREAQDLLRDALTPEMMEQMKKLENSTRELNGEQSRDALKNMAEMQKKLREQLEKSAEMLKRAALEGAMETLKDEAKEIADKQRQMVDSAPKDAEGKKEQGEKLADRSERLSNDVKQLQQRLQKEKADAASQKANSAQQHAEKSEQQMRQQDAKNAASQMDQAAKDLQDAREQQVGEWKKELTDALDQSIQELLQMARQESALEEKARQAGRDQAKTEPLRGQQSAVQQGVEKTAEKMQKEGNKTSLLSGRAQRAMNEAMQKAQQATQQLTEQRGGQQASSSLGDAAEALNRAAASLARDRERANSSNSATGFSEMIQQMQEMAKKQGSINAQAQGLMPIPGQGQMNPEAQATARMLARQQRSIANQLEEISDAAGGDRAGELAKEARQLAEALEQTRVDAQTVARQQQLFRRMLDAGRSLEKEEREDNDKREAKSATGDNKYDPGTNAARGKAGQKFGEPTWDELRGLSADERRAILEYFKRINAKQP
jgi:hypothetical protein